ncbi:MAG TPA: RimK/LysX family protein [Aestuariivirga sp.]|nr:RimK/LysX family protein [Aestuariivirga sp.]
MPRQKSKHRPPTPPIVVGWREYVRLPDLGIDEFAAKMDTGAEYCTLHATDIKPGRDSISFRFESGKKLRAALIGKKYITSSNGISAKRFVIRTRIKIGKKTIRSTVTLLDRSKMKVKMLLGRRLLSNRFVVNPKLSFVLGNGKKKTKAK